LKFVASPLAYLMKQPLIRDNLARLTKLFGVLFLMIGASSVLFHLIMLHEGREYSWVTGLYWTLTVMSTLGFGDITFTSDLGKLFSIVVLIGGVMMLLIVLPFAFIRFFYAPWIEAHMRLRAPRGIPESTKGHVVICRNDAIAGDLADRLRYAKIPYYILEADLAVAAQLHGDQMPVIAGDAQAASTWEAMRVTQARAVLANLTDPENTNVVLTVRHLAPDVEVITTAEEEDSVDILQLSGASLVLPVKQRLGEHLANRVNAGHAEVHTIGRYRDLVIGEFPVHRTPLVGRSLRDLGLRRKIGVSVVGVWERGKFEPANPDRVLTPSSVPVVIGTPEQILELNALLVIYDTNYEATVVIGGGKVGAAATRALRARDLKVHVVEQDPEVAAKLEGIADQVIVGQAADREVLRRAGLENAPAVILTTNDDSINIYLTVYCRKLNPDLRIISRITHEQNLEAVHRAGADFVLGYSSLAAESVFSNLQGRGVMMFGAGIELFHVDVPRPLAGKTLEEAKIGEACGANVIAVKHGEEIVTNPPPSQRLPKSAELLMLGTHEQRQSFHRLFG